MNTFVLFYFGLAFGLSLYEFVQVLRARMHGLTKSTGRVVLRGLIFLSILMFYSRLWDWQQYLNNYAPELDAPRLVNMPFVLCCAALSLVFLLGTFDFIGLVQARRQGLTKNTSRLVSTVIIILCLIPLLQETINMWDRYTTKLQQPSVLGAAENLPPH